MWSLYLLSVRFIKLYLIYKTIVLDIIIRKQVSNYFLNDEKKPVNLEVKQFFVFILVTQ